MKKVILAIAVISCLSFQSCKKCWDCGESVDGNKVKTCDKQRMEAIEAGQVYSDINGNPISRACH